MFGMYDLKKLVELAGAAKAKKGLKKNEPDSIQLAVPGLHRRRLRRMPAACGEVAVERQVTVTLVCSCGARLEGPQLESGLGVESFECGRCDSYHSRIEFTCPVCKGSVYLRQDKLGWPNA